MFAVRKLKCCSEALFIHAIVALGSFNASQAACAMPQCGVFVRWRLLFLILSSLSFQQC